MMKAEWMEKTYRPAWFRIRMLANAQGFDRDLAEELREEILAGEWDDVPDTNFTDIVKCRNMDEIQSIKDRPLVAAARTRNGIDMNPWVVA
ncbi:hypothetical protein HK097_008969 [Rhizophlyctis rosea]|uniref:Uncharacterized protein n=1 Tax=Rhizophlyctis rosea TaxID=64517 RepID=A0AAD5SHZ8_9FUNG|nr:hypothetical protein HK097_008969 [Rhizophlyctis rosea]